MDPNSCHLLDKQVKTHRVKGSAGVYAYGRLQNVIENEVLLSAWNIAREPCFCCMFSFVINLSGPICMSLMLNMRSFIVVSVWITAQEYCLRHADVLKAPLTQDILLTVLQNEGVGMVVVRRNERETNFAVLVVSLHVLANLQEHSDAF